MLMKSMKNSRGFSLLELLLGMVMGLVVLSGVTYIYVTIVVSTSETLKQAKLNTQLMTVMSLISNDIRRSHYWANPSAQAPSTNPFIVEDSTLLTIFDSENNLKVEVDDDDAPKAGDCILYTYDKNSDGVVGTATNNEYFGFKRENNSIYMAIRSDAFPATTCGGNGWEEIVDSDLINITELEFDLASSACINSSEPDGVDSAFDADSDDDVGEKNCYVVQPSVGQTTVETFEVVITLSGQLVNDSEVKKTLTQIVRVRNDVVRVH